MVGLLGCRARSWIWMILVGPLQLRILNSLHLFQFVPVKPRFTGSSRHHICVISPTIRLQRWIMMRKFYFFNKISLVLLLGEFLLPSTVKRRGAGDAPGLLLLCIPWTHLSVIPTLGIMELNGCRLRKFYFFLFLQLCKHVWLNPGVSYTTIPHTYI